MDLPVSLSVHNILSFLEYLYQNGLSPKVIKNYLSSISSVSKNFNLDISSLSHISVAHYLRSISINSSFRLKPRGIFNITTLYHISRACDTLSDPVLYRALFLTAFFGFLRMSNLAPHSSAKFDHTKHFLRQDLFLHPPGVHLLIKWTKSLQDHTSHHLIQLPELNNFFLCPTRALKTLIKSRPLSPTAPLFANNFPPFSSVIDTHIRDSLKKILTLLGISPSGHGFHTFRRSGATFAFDHNVPLQNIMAYGLWRSSAVWTYLQNSSHSSSIISATFAAHVPSNF